MRLPPVSSLRLLLILGLPVLVLAAACSDDEIVFREPFNPPPDSTAGLLGYFTTTDKQTTCGNCHVSHQTDWATTKHATAYADLTASAGAQDFCFSCHTVNELGNSLTDTSGWHVVQDTAYYDVQCESCHGPGADHVENPDGGPKPLASITVSLDATNGCAECHNGTHHPFVEEWSQSAHATPEAHVIERDPAEAGECTPCHTAQGALAAWGVNTEYVEKGDAVPDQEGITCPVCHDPHGAAGTEGQLRYPVDVPSMEQNLCAKCHQRRSQPEVESGSTRGPHSPEAPLLFGEVVGWVPPGFTYQPNEILGTHGTEANPRVCATCHVVNYEVTDTADIFQVQVVGHRFEAIPCVDANGAPLPAAAPCDSTTALTERDFTHGCTTSGCHGSDEAARSAYTTAKNRIQNLVDETNAKLALVPPEEFTDSLTFTVAEGVTFNVELAELPGSPIHNPFLIEQLLLASQAALDSTYGLSGPVVVDMKRLQQYRQLKVDGKGR
jgi:predicted CXXCH cytochrome family protein